jgi:hypothetical protein
VITVQGSLVPFVPWSLCPSLSEAKGKAAQAAVHFLKLRHVEDEGAEAARDQFAVELPEAFGDKDAVVDADAVGGVALRGRDAKQVEADELRIEPRIFGHFFHDHEGVVADVADAAFQMQNGGHRADVDRGCGVAERIEMGCELVSAGLVGAVRDADEEVVFSFADIPSIDGSRRVNRECPGIESLDNGPNGGNFPLAAGCAGPGEDGSVRREDGRVFNEGGVGVAQIGIDDCERESAFAQGIAIACVLVKDFVKVGTAEIDGGKTVGEVAAGNAYDGASKRECGSECRWAG